MPQGHPEVTRLSVKDELRFQAWAHRNGITDVDHPDSHYDYRGYWRSTKGAPHEPGAHFPDTFKQHGHPTFSVESQYSRGPNDGGHWQGETFIPPRSSSQPGIVYASQHDQRIPSDILPNFRPRNRAGEVASSLAFNHPALAGALSGAGNVAKGVANFIPDAIRGLSSFTPEDLRDPAVRKEITDNHWGDPDRMLHEALKARGRGEPVGSSEYAMSLLKGTAFAGYNLQRAVQGGALFEQGANGKIGVANNDVSPRERAQAITEMIGNAGLLASGVQDKSLPVSRLPMSTAGRAAAALRDAVGPSAILPQDWASGPRAPGPGPRTPVGNLNMEAPAYQRATYKAPASAPNTSLDVPTYKRNGSLSPAMRRLQAENAPPRNPIAVLADEYRQSRGLTHEPLPPVTAADISPEAHRALAQYYEQTPSGHTNPAVRASYRALMNTINDQADFLKSKGYRMGVVDNPTIQSIYETPQHMHADVLKNKNLDVNRTTFDQANLPAGEQPVVPGQAHPILTNAENDVFRWVHDILGHTPTESDFSLPGEEQAYRNHAATMPAEALPALAAETRGQTGTYFHGSRPGTFVQQKALAFPEHLTGDYPGILKGPAAVERIKMPEILGANGKYYTGLNHDLASEAAAEDMRSTPEGRAAMQKNGGSATVRNSQGFETTTGRHIGREEARGIAGATGQAPKLSASYTQLHSSDMTNPNNFAGEHPIPQDLIDAAREPAPQAPNIITRRPSLFDPNVGAPSISQMIRAHGRPESGSILKYVDPGTYLHDVPQTVFDLPAPKKGILWGSHYSNAREVLNLQNQFLMDAIYRGLDLNRNGPGQSYPWWYNAEPILGSAIEHLGPELGRERFNMLVDRMKPTSINTEPVRNLRNASYQYYRTGNPSAPLFTEGYRPLYPTDMTKFLQQLERQGGHMTQPKIEPYGEAFKGNWGTSIGDMHYHRSLEALGVPYGANADPGVRWGPYNAAFTDFAHDLEGAGLIPSVPGRSPAAPAQATMWGGMGEHTGVENIKTTRPTIWQMFEDATHRSAQHLGMKAEDFLHHFWNRDVPLF